MRKNAKGQVLLGFLGTLAVAIIVVAVCCVWVGRASAGCTKTTTCSGYCSANLQQKCTTSGAPSTDDICNKKSESCNTCKCPSDYPCTCAE
jgi:hypothetical protein